MPQFANISAGFYFGETDLSRAASQTAKYSGTTIAVVGAAAMGPLIPTWVTNPTQYNKLYGYPQVGLYPMGYAAQYTLPQTAAMWVTRVVAPDALSAVAYLMVDDCTAPFQQIGLYPEHDNLGESVGMYDPANSIAFNSALPGIENVVGAIYMANPGTWNNQVVVRVRPYIMPGQTSTKDASLFYVDVLLDPSPLAVPVESWLVSLTMRMSPEGTQMQVEHKINRSSAYIRFMVNLSVSPTIRFDTTDQIMMAGGTNGSAPSANLLAQAWAEYSSVDLYALDLLLNCGYTDPIVQAAMIDVVNKRRDCHAALDSARDSVTITPLLNVRNSLGTPQFAALYTPWIQILDTNSRVDVMAPPSCFVGDVFAFTDANYGIAFGPAGEQRGVIGDATGLSYSYNVPERDILTANQINYFRTLPGVQGVVLWGASSLDNTGSVMADIAARRVVSRVEKNLSKVLRSFTFDMPLPDMLDSIASITTATLQAMLGAEGLLDFSVLCDSTNNPSPSLQMGDIYLEIDIVPTPTAKRIMLGVTINKHTGIGFTENG